MNKHAVLHAGQSCALAVVGVHSQTVSFCALAANKETVGGIQGDVALVGGGIGNANEDVVRKVRSVGAPVAHLGGSLTGIAEDVVVEFILGAVVEGQQFDRPAVQDVGTHDKGVVVDLGADAVASVVEVTHGHVGPLAAALVFADVITNAGVIGNILVAEAAQHHEAGIVVEVVELYPGVVIQRVHLNALGVLGDHAGLDGVSGVPCSADAVGIALVILEHYVV